MLLNVKSKFYFVIFAHIMYNMLKKTKKTGDRNQNRVLHVVTIIISLTKKRLCIGINNCSLITPLHYLYLSTYSVYHVC